jgi:hypothetical protein
MTKDIAGVVRDFFGVSSAKPYRGKDTTLGTYSSVGSGFSGRLKPGDPDDFLKLLEQRANKMPARPRRAPRGASSRSSKRKAPRGKKRSVKRKAPIRKSTKRKKRKVSKGVSLTVGTARERRVDHHTYGTASGLVSNAALYIPMNSIGPKEEMLEMVAQALLLHYMHRTGDYRANTSMVPLVAQAAASSAQSTTWSYIRFHFCSLASTSDADYFDVWSWYDGSSVAEQTLKAMSTRLAGGLLAQATHGRRLTQVSVYRDVSSVSSATDDQCILLDISAGRNVLEFTSKASLKMQNVTPADVVHSDAQTCGHDNALNINRNPLDGLVYKFRNQVPKFKMQYLISKLDTPRKELSTLSDCYATHEAGIAPLNLPAYGDEWKVPPPSPSTIFSNYSGKTGISIAAGGHATQYMSESYKGPVNSFFERYFPIRASATVEFEVPPGGSSLMVCLKPKFRNSSQANLKIEAEIDHTYCARVSRAKLTPLPMNTILA